MAVIAPGDATSRTQSKGASGASPYAWPHVPTPSAGSAGGVNRMRSASWWAIRARRARSSASASIAPRTSRRTDWFQWSRESIASAKNAAWMGVSGTGPAAGVTSARGASSGVAARASSRIVWCSNTLRGVSPTPRSRARLTMRMETMESPPSSKKLSSTPIPATPRSSDQIAASATSTLVSGAAPPGAADEAGAGSARRSTFPFGVRGNAATGITCDGTRGSGRRARRCARSSAVVGAAASSTAHVT